MSKLIGVYKHEWYMENRERLIINAKKWALKNPEKIKQAQNKWRRKNLLKSRSYRYLRLGIKKEEIDNLLKNSNKLCEICKEEKILYIDHCHRQVKLRGLLCQQCNIGLGSFKDSVIHFKNAIRYLDKFTRTSQKVKQERI